MTECCDKPDPQPECCAPRPSPCCDSAAGGADAPCDALDWFANGIPNTLAWARAAHEAGTPLVGIMCEYTPRELILAAGAAPVCLCGGSADMVTPAEQHLPVNLCPLIKSTFGYHVEKANPFLEMTSLVVSETTCDGKKKMVELMGESRPMHVLELPQKPDLDASLAGWRGELVKLKDALEQRFGVEITDDRLRDAIGLMNRERAARRELAELMKGDCPPITGRQLLDVHSTISGIPEEMEQYRGALAALQGRAGDPEPPSRVRVLMTGEPIVHGAERVLEIIEDNGGLVVCMENCSGIKPILEDVDASADDPLGALAEKYYHLPCSVMTRNDRRLETIRHLAGEYRAECIIELIWQACLTYDVESHYVRRLAGELGLPYLRIETDYSPSDSARIAVRVEALFETVQAGGAPAS